MKLFIIALITFSFLFTLIKNSSAPAPAAPTQVIPSNVSKKFLTIMAVNSGAQSKYEDNSWERTLKFKENDNVQIFEVAIWNNGQPTNPGKISLYKFDKTFDPFKTEYINGGPAWVQYRESFNILNINIPTSCKTAQGADYYACSNSYLDAFKLIFKTIVANQPANHYGIKYLGHGTNGGLFENTLSESDSKLLLAYTNSTIGNKLDFLDWSTNCDMGTYNVLANQYQYADYILSSDLLRGGFAIDWVNDYYRLKPEAILDQFFSPSKTIRQSLIEMVDSERKLWETATVKNDMISKQNKQSLSIYDSSKFQDLINTVNLPQGLQSGDVLDYVRKNYSAQEQKFYDFRFHYVSNKDFFPWDTDSNGFKRN